MKRKHLEIGFEDLQEKITPTVKEPEENGKSEELTEDTKEDLVPSKKSRNSTQTKESSLKSTLPIKDSKYPPNWEDMWDLIEKMRSEKIAPVDTMGCHTLADITLSEKEFRFQCLVGLMLSSQTKDPITAEAMQALRLHGLTIDNILQTDDQVLDKLIRKVGFHNKKTIYIKKVCQILKEKYDKDIPRKVEDVMKLPGVGPKMAMLLMQEAWNECVGIGVDVHVHRISNRIGWVHNTKNPEETRKELQSWLPKDKWKPINRMLVGFGQTICTPIKPKCGDCLASSLCPSAFKCEKVKKKKKE